LPQQIDRRRFLKLVGGTLGGFVILNRSGTPSANATPLVPPQYFCPVPNADISFLHDASNLARFVDPLPIPRVIQPGSTYLGMPMYEVIMRQFTQQLHRDLPPTTLWGYDGVYPGPTFEVEQNQSICVLWRNNLPAQHLFKRDTTLHGAEPDKPPVRTVVHLHGAKVLPEYDGYPEAWFTKDFAQTGPYFSHEIYQYSNEQPATALWYHDHALGDTRLNIYAGLAGFYLIRSDAERALNLPSGAFEIPLLIQDCTFNLDGSLFYPVGGINPALPPVWDGDFFGNTVLVNGKVWPYLEVEPRKYRFRFLNGSSSRFYHLFFTMDGNAGATPSFTIIGTDGGFMGAPVTLDAILAAPAQRFDVVIDFSGYEGKRMVLGNDAPGTYPDGSYIVPNQVMQFRVKSQSSSPDSSSLPSKLYPVPALDPAMAVTTRDIHLTAMLGPKFMVVLNGHWDGPVTETPLAGTTEIWRLINHGAVAHPIHIHPIQFQVLDRQPFVAVNSDSFAGPPQLPPPEELGAWKDTVIASAKMVTRVIAKFDLPRGADTTPGTRHRYVYHCHIIGHEDNEMMRPYDIVS
jgi:spore coat protein A, manganese oxidase